MRPLPKKPTERYVIVVKSRYYSGIIPLSFDKITVTHHTDRYLQLEKKSKRSPLSNSERIVKYYESRKATHTYEDVYNFNRTGFKFVDDISEAKRINKWPVVENIINNLSKLFDPKTIKVQVV